MITGSFFEPDEDPEQPGRIIPIQSYTVKIGGEVVDSYIASNNDPHKESAGGTYMFDSTHFGPSETVSVKIEMLSDENEYASYEFAADCRNQATSYNRYDFEQISPIINLVEWYESFMNYDIDLHSNAGWTAQDYHTSIFQANNVYISTHGDLVSGALYLRDDRDDYSIQSNLPAHWIYAVTPPTVSPFIYDDGLGPTVAQTRELAAGIMESGYNLPPFNLGQPPISLVFHDACYGAGMGSNYTAGQIWA